MAFYNISTEVEAQVGALLCIFNGLIEFTYTSSGSTHDLPNDESVTVYKTELDKDDEQAMYFIDGEQVGEAEAWGYYKRYVKEHYEEVIPEKLSKFMLLHLDLVAEDRALDCIRNLY